MSVDLSMFDMSGTSFVQEEKQENLELYTIDCKKTKNGVHEALVRFIPNLKDKNKSLITKYTAFLKDPVTGDKRNLDSLRTIGKAKECPIAQSYYKVRESQDASVVEHKDMFLQREVHYALIQILEDKQNPDNVGKIKILKFGQKIKALYDAEEKPKKGKSKNPFDIRNGRPFFLDVRLVKDYNNYDNCQFVDVDDDGLGNVLLGGEPIDWDNVDNNTLKKLQEFFINNSPDLTQYDYKPMSNDDLAFIDRVLRNIGADSNGQLTSGLVNKKVQETKKANTHTVTDDEEDEDVISIKKETKKTSTPPPTTKTSKKDEDDEDGDVFDGLDDIDVDDLDL